MTSTNMLGFNEVVLSCFFQIWDLFGCSFDFDDQEMFTCYDVDVFSR